MYIFFLFLLCFSILIAEGKVELENSWKRLGLVDIKSLLPKVKVNIKYASKDNFMKANVYEGMDKCYLQSIVAKRLIDSYNYLQKIKPGYNFLIYDGARPHRVQVRMWDLVKGTSKEPYVANPKKGSIHNYGSAIDLTILDNNGKELDMGTEYDYFGKLAEPVLEKKFLASGELTIIQINNRKLLRNVMRKGNFKVRSNEWWHFDAFGINESKKRFSLLE